MQKFKAKRILLPAMTLLAISTLIGCDKVSDIQNVVAVNKSKWKYSKSIDKMSQAEKFEAEFTEISTDVPLVQTSAKVICIPGADDLSFHVELTTYNSQADKNGVVNPMPIKMESLGDGQQGMFARLLLKSSGTIPTETQFNQYATVSIRTNEDKADTQLLQNIPSVSIEFNNRIYLFPFMIEKANGLLLTSMRVAVDTDQGTVNLLIPFEDENVSKVVAACKDHRIHPGVQSLESKQPPEKVEVTKNSPAPSQNDLQSSIPKESNNTKTEEIPQAVNLSSSKKQETTVAPSVNSNLQAPVLKSIDAPAEAKDKLNEMLRNSQSAYKISELKAQLESIPKPVAGDRRIARKINEQALNDLKESKYTLATEGFKKALDADPADIEIRNNYLYSLIKDKQYGKAETVAGELLSFSPGRSSAWVNLAELYAETNRDAESVAALTIAFQFSSNKDKTIKFLNENIAKEGSKIQKQSAAALEIIKKL